jgi:hypothetical protein
VFCRVAGADAVGAGGATFLGDEETTVLPPVVDVVPEPLGALLIDRVRVVGLIAPLAVAGAPVEPVVVLPDAVEAAGGATVVEPVVVEPLVTERGVLEVDETLPVPDVLGKGVALPEVGEVLPDVSEVPVLDEFEELVGESGDVELSDVVPPDVELPVAVLSAELAVFSASLVDGSGVDSALFAVLSTVVSTLLVSTISVLLSRLAKANHKAAATATNTIAPSAQRPPTFFSPSSLGTAVSPLKQVCIRLVDVTRPLARSQLQTRCRPFDNRLSASFSQNSAVLFWAPLTPAPKDCIMISNHFTDLSESVGFWILKVTL